MARYRLTAAQRRFYESGGGVVLVGQRSGRRYASEMQIVAFAANEEEARLCIEDLHTVGCALQSGDGYRIKPPGRNGARFKYIRFDEERK